MKKVLAASALIMMSVICSCEQKNPVSEYGERMMDAKKSAENAAVQSNLDTVQKTVQAYRAANGEFPKELKDVDDMLRGSVDLSKYDYDPQTGVVSLKQK